MHDVSEATAGGLFMKVPPEQRLVPEESDPWRHVQLACEAAFPDKERVGAVTPPFLEAIERILDLGNNLEAYRAFVCEEIEECVALLAPFSEAARQLVAPHLRMISARLNLPMVCAFVECLEPIEASQTPCSPWTCARACKWPATVPCKNLE